MGVLSGVVAVLVLNDKSPRKAPPCKYIKKVCKQAGYGFSPNDRTESIDACLLPILNTGKFGELTIDANIVAKCKIRLDKKRAKSPKKPAGKADLKNKDK